MVVTESLSDMENLFAALADKTRLRLLNLIRDEEVCVCFFVEVLGESQPKISRHLAYLRKSGLVTARRDGKWMHYRINFPEDDNLRRALQNTLDGLTSRPEMQGEFEDLIKACCSPEAPVTISKAPKPETLLDTDMLAENDELETFLL